jgi:hypothetical protein
MKSIRETLKVPSAALQAMVNGLRKQSKRSDFKIDMGTFGDAYGGVCYGCAATCALQEISGIDFTLENMLWHNLPYATPFSGQEISDFEDVIDAARSGYLLPLFTFFHLHPIHNRGYPRRFNLDTDNWEEQLPEVEKLIAELKEKGL